MRHTLLAATALLTFALPAAAEPLPLTPRPIERFNLTGDDTGGPLTFIGGLALASTNRDFGGLSGIDMLDADTAFIIGDTGTYVRARLVHEKGRLVGIEDAEIGDLFPEGAISKQRGDVEDVALDPADRSSGVIVRERQANALLTFTLSDAGPTDFEPKRVGADDRILRSNRGLESVAFAPPASPAAGEIVTIAERALRVNDDIPGWIAGIGAFTIARRDDYDISSARFLPDGDLIILERRFIPPLGLSMRIRRLPGEALAVGARLDGDVLLDANLSSQINNMEGIAVSEDADGRVILTLVSDDNYNVLQRTLILQFALAPD